MPQADIALPDPHFAPALVTRNHAYLVYDTLYGVDDAARPHPQMTAGHVTEADDKTWKITLREGLRFHDGEKVLARDAVASLKRWAKRGVYAISSFTQVEKLSAISDDVLQFRLKRPFRLLADLLGKPGPFAPAIMPERFALTEPGQQVKEIIGSGPTSSCSRVRWTSGSSRPLTCYRCCAATRRLRSTSSTRSGTTPCSASIICIPLRPSGH